MSDGFEVTHAAKMILADMMRLNISFNESWEDYNKTWYDNQLEESDKDNVMKLISEAIDSIG